MITTGTSDIVIQTLRTFLNELEVMCVIGVHPIIFFATCCRPMNFQILSLSDTLHKLKVDDNNIQCECWSWTLGYYTYLYSFNLFKTSI